MRAATEPIRATAPPRVKLAWAKPALGWVELEVAEGRAVPEPPAPLGISGVGIDG